jgi:excisionase family DNA binding protein
MSLTIEEAAKLSNIGVLKMRGLIASNEVPHFKIGVKTMINRILLEEYIAKISIERRKI